MSNQRIGIITQARTTSSRLPKKVLLPINGKTILQYHVERTRESGYPVFLATTINETDNEIYALSEKLSLPCFRGSEHDVLSRFYETAKRFELEVIVRVTSDCPLIAGELIKEGVETYLKQDNPNSYVSNCIERTYPRGFDFEIFSFKALESAYHLAKSDPEREHVTPFVRNPEKNHGVNLVHIKNKVDASKFRITLDEEDDWTLIQTLIKDFKADKMKSNEIIDLLSKNPSLANINMGVEQKKV